MKSQTARPHYSQFPIPPDVPEGWTPKCIRCMSLTVAVNERGALLLDYVKVGDFAPDDLDKALKQTLVFDEPSDCAGDPSVDLNLCEALLMVLQLPASLNMQYAPDGDAITLKERVTKGAYGKLMHLRADGTFTPGPPGEGCKLAYFAAQPPHETPIKFEDGFNINVQLLQQQQQQSGKKRQFVRHLPMLIDPFVKNPGGQGGG